MKNFKLAAAQYPVEFLGSWDAYEAKLSAWVAEAAGAGAQLLVFPEYASMDLASLLEPEVYGSLRGQLPALQPLLPRFLGLHQELARRHGVYIVAGSFLTWCADGGYRNRTHLLSPDGNQSYQDKLLMTRFEREQWGLVGGDEIKVFATELGLLGISICYDSEFPLLTRAQVEAGADLILVPSATDTEAGYNRVRLSCQARALENQCYVVQSPLVGDVDWSDAVDVSLGAAGVFTPVDYGFPANGILAQGERERPGWIYAQIDTTRAQALRETGQVLNHRDWPRQRPVVDTGVRRVAV